MAYDVGDLVRVGNPSQDTTTAAFATLAGTATDPDAVTLDVERPDGTQLGYGWPVTGTDGMLMKESTGRFYVDIEIDQAGWWKQRLAGTGAVTAASEDAFYVRPRIVEAPIP